MREACSHAIFQRLVTLLHSVFSPNKKMLVKTQFEQKNLDKHFFFRDSKFLFVVHQFMQANGQCSIVKLKTANFLGKSSFSIWKFAWSASGCETPTKIALTTTSPLVSTRVPEIAVTFQDLHVPQLETNQRKRRVCVMQELLQQVTCKEQRHNLCKSINLPRFS